ncbi:undecaprenyl-phosphate galactose phosphotransferase WbaP [Acidobacteriota bacterium]
MKKKIISLVSLVIIDFVALLACFLLAYLIRSEFLSFFFDKFEKGMLDPLPTYLNYSYIAFIWFLIFFYEKLYTKRFPFWDEVKVLVKSTTLSSTLVIVLIFLIKKQFSFSTTLIVLLWIISLFLFPLFRFFTKILLIKFNIWTKKLIILGTNKTSYLAYKGIIQNRTMGYSIVGFFKETPQISKEFHSIKILGSMSEFEELVGTQNSKDIMIALPDLPKEQLNQLISKCENRSESLWIVPRIGDIITTGIELEAIGQVLALRTKKNLEKPWNILLKTLFDTTLSLVLFFLLLPFLLIISLAVKLDTKGPIIYRQKRLGKMKKTFDLYKFRSMYVNGENKLHEYLKDRQDAHEEWKKFRKLKNHDPRVTRIGKFIRSRSLDELPQLINVIQGNMSLVGPRPYLVEELKEKDSFKAVVSKVKPGITGLWQISGRSDLPFEDRLALDEHYIRNWDLWLDITILFKSVKIWFTKKGAY